MLPWSRANAFTGALVIWGLALFYHTGLFVLRPARGDLLTRQLAALCVARPVVYVGAFFAMLAAAAGIIVARLRKHGPLDVRALPKLLLEGAASAGLLYVLTSAVADVPMALDAAEPAMRVPSLLLVACGAGVYEELVFRGVLLLPVVRGGAIPSLVSPRTRALMGLLGSAFLFAIAHVVAGEPWHESRFGARLVAGCVLGILCLRRGLAVAVLAHIGCDVAALLRHAGVT